MTDFNALLAAVAGHAAPDRLADAMARVLPAYGIDTPLRIAHFVGQVCEETGGFLAARENLNYSADALLRLWPSHFTPQEAQAFAHHPADIAERAYGGRLGNGPTGCGDGARFIGRGLIQITGRDNYARAAADTGLPLLEHPELLEEWGDAAVAASAAFWRRAGCNELADADNIVAITKRVNGGLINFAARKAYVTKAKAFLAAQPQQVPIPAPVAPSTPAPVAEAPPAADTPPAPPAAPTPDAPDFTPLWQNLATMARDRLASFGGGGAAIGAGLLAWVHKLSAADAVMLVGAGLFVLALVLYWGSRKEHRHEAEKQQALNTPAPGQPLLSEAQLAAITSAVVSALASRG